MKRTDEMLDALSPHSIDAAHCEARLALGFKKDADTTRLIDRQHFGPLRVQKPLYPEGSEICHAIIVHPPGGVVGGDTLSINAKVGEGAGAFITTPGAAKWYKSNGFVSRQDIQLSLGENATMEWLPQETIFFRSAHVQLNQTIHLEKNARYIGSDILCFGRTASGEIFDEGIIRQRVSIRLDGKLIWLEQGSIDGSSTAMNSPLALHGNTVCATLVAVGKPLPSSLINHLRDQLSTITCGHGICNVSQLKSAPLNSVLVARYLGNSSETAKQCTTWIWQQLRPHFIGRDAVVPRIWNT